MKQIIDIGLLLKIWLKKIDSTLDKKLIELIEALPLFSSVFFGVLISIVFSYFTNISLPNFNGSPLYEVNLIRPAPSSEICETKVYDKDGTGYLKVDYLIEGYTGDAPLYVLSPADLKLKKNNAGCYDYPSRIDATQAIGGGTLYPVLVTVNGNKKKMKTYKGESIGLVVDAKIQTEFNDDIWPIEIRSGQLKELNFAIDAPSFDSYSKDQRDKISLSKSAATSWYIFPKATADGIQEVRFIIDGEAFSAEEKTDVTIQNNRFGFDPIIALIFIGVIAIITFIIKEWKNIKDINQDIKNKFTNKDSQKIIQSPTELNQDDQEHKPENINDSNK